jgi:carboxypeptidase Q
MPSSVRWVQRGASALLTWISFLLLPGGGIASARAQLPPERIDLDAVGRIKREALEHSEIPALARHLVDVVGSRLTGSPGMRSANAWTAAKLREWGLANVSVESWGENGRGWESLEYSGMVLSPNPQPMPGVPHAWTRGTAGPVTGPAIIVKGRAWDSLATLGNRVRRAFILSRPPTSITPLPRATDRRIPDDSLRSATGLDYLFGRAMRKAIPDTSNADVMRGMMRRYLTNVAVRFDKEIASGVAAFIVPSEQPRGVIAGFGEYGGKSPSLPLPIPYITIGQEQYNQIYRNVSSGVPVQLQVNVRNRFLTDDLNGYNTLADLPGTDRANELIMIGAHLDSWHFAGGATDNAAGVVVMMEAMRILKTLGLQPRRTIRLALWSGEEDGLLGSGSWVAKNREVWPRISAYLNMDYGTGRIRGLWSHWNDAAIPILEQHLKPLQDIGVTGPGIHRGDVGGSDHESFLDAGIPAFFFIQDLIEYRDAGSPYHSTLDTYDHLLIDDLKQAAAVVAATAYGLANRDELLPRRPAK